MPKGASILRGVESTDPPGGGGLEARVARLESDVEYIKRDLSEIKTDVRAIAGKVDKINLRLAYATGALFGGSLLAGWLVSGKLDTILTAINSTP